MRRLLLLLLLLHVGTRPVAAEPLVSVPESVERFGKIELSVDVDGTVDNPFDPDRSSVQGQFIDPDGRAIVVDGFYYQDFERSLAGSDEKLQPRGAPGWRIRFAPTKVGAWRCTVTARVNGTTQTSDERRFLCRPGKSPGFVRVGPNRTHFAFDSGAPYFAVGENVCWSGRRGTYDYDDWFARLSDVGANYARLWIGPFDSFTLERRRRHPQDAAGAGRYDLANAWRLDAVLEQAESRGLYLMLCTQSFNALRSRPEYPMWNDNPYNAALGGPLQHPRDFFTDPAARDLYRRLLRYLVARYGYSTHVLSWELWNEVDLVDGYRTAAVKAWHAEMADALHRMDPYRHLVTTSFADSDGNPDVDALPALDYVQTHNYGALDEVATLSGFCRQKSQRYAKPHYVGEFGVDTHVQGNAADPTGVHLHNGLWAPVFSQAAGTGMIWWWDNYIDPSHLYPLFRPVANFVRDVPWIAHAWRPLAVAAMAWAGRPPSTGLHLAEQVMHKGAAIEVTVNASTEDRFLLHVLGVSAPGTRLRLWRDGEPALQQEFPVVGRGDCHQYDGPYAVHLSPGAHQLRVETLGPGTLRVSGSLESDIDPQRPNLLVLAQGDASYAIAWMQNRDHTWYRMSKGLALRPVPPARITLSGFPDGTYEVEWWDTDRGVPTRTLQATSTANRLVLLAPEVRTDVACKIRRRQKRGQVIFFRSQRIW